MAPTLGNGKICYVELPANDIARSAEFYGKVFGWNIRSEATTLQRLTTLLAK